MHLSILWSASSHVGEVKAPDPSYSKAGKRSSPDKSLSSGCRPQNNQRYPLDSVIYLSNKPDQMFKKGAMGAGEV